MEFAGKIIVGKGALAQPRPHGRYGQRTVFSRLVISCVGTRPGTLANIGKSIAANISHTFEDDQLFNPISFSKGAVADRLQTLGQIQRKRPIAEFTEYHGRADAAVKGVQRFTIIRSG